MAKCPSDTVTAMARPIRLEFPGALYHVTSRGNRRGAIYRNKSDRQTWLRVLARVCARHNCVVHCFCQMTNHYHLLVETLEPNLSRVMHQLNGLYTQLFNRRHGLAGHLFEGRYHAVLVQKESHLLELSRYIVLNPLRGNVVSSLEDWEWSSYHLLAYAHAHPAPEWHECDWLLSQFGNSDTDAIAAYRSFILAGVGRASPLTSIRCRILLGDNAFVEKHQQLRRSEEFGEAAKAERRAVTPSLREYRNSFVDRNEAMARAYLSTAFTMPQIAAAFGVSTKTVSRAVAEFEKKSELS